MSTIVGTLCVPTCGDRCVSEIVGTFCVLDLNENFHFDRCGDSCVFIVISNICEYVY